MHGDYEAQRHWMELTTALPMGEWYRNTTRNDLLFWGLDYPPLTAFWAWATGKAAQALMPELVEWEKSRGHQGEAAPGAKLFMRLLVLFGDLLVWLPAAALFAWTVASLPRRKAGLQQQEGKETREVRQDTLAGEIVAGLLSVCSSDGREQNDEDEDGDRESRRRRWQQSFLVTFALLALGGIPYLLVIDHGHYQFNSISLGLALFGLCALLAPMTVTTTTTTATSISYLSPLHRFWVRYSPLMASFFFCCALGYKQMLLYYSPFFFVVLATRCCILLAYSTSDGEGGASSTSRPDTGVEIGIGQRVRDVLDRISMPHPLDYDGDEYENEDMARGEREKKQEKSSGGSACACLLAFALVGAVVLLTFAVIFLPFCLAGGGGGNEDGRSDAVVFDDGLKGSCFSGLKAVVVRLFPLDRNVFEDKVANIWCSLEPVLKYKKKGMFDMAAARETARICMGTTIWLLIPGLCFLARITWDAFSSSLAYRRSVLRFFYPLHLFAALFVVSSSFFLASYQVHEKSVLMPALAATLMQAVLMSMQETRNSPLLQLFAPFFTLVSVWTMWPLLSKDGLLLQASALTALYLLLFTPWRLLGDVAVTRPRFLIAILLLLAMAAVSFLACAVSPPSGLPDLWPYLSSVVGCVAIGFCWCIAMGIILL